MSRPAWLDEPQVQAAVAANAAAAPALTEAQLDLLRRTGFFTPATAAPSPARPLAPAGGLAAGEGTGAAGSSILRIAGEQTTGRSIRGAS